MATHRIPKIHPSIHDPRVQHCILYDIARKYTNEELFIGLTALEQPFTPVRCLDDVFLAVQHSLRCVSKQYGWSEECLTQSMLRLRTKYGVHVRNRAQVEADRFGMLGREGPMSGERQKALARRMLEEWRRDVKKSVAEEPAAADEASIRERMSLKNILN